MTKEELREIFVEEMRRSKRFRVADLVSEYKGKEIPIVGQDYEDACMMENIIDRISRCCKPSLKDELAKLGDDSPLLRAMGEKQLKSRAVDGI